MNLIELELFVIRRIKDVFDIGFVLRWNRCIDEDEIEFLMYRFGLFVNLFFENLVICLEFM